MNPLARDSEQGSGFSSGELRPPGVSHPMGHGPSEGGRPPRSRHRLLVDITEEGGQQPTRRRHRLRGVVAEQARHPVDNTDRKSTRLNSSHVAISYAVFCLKKKKEILLIYE